MRRSQRLIIMLLLICCSAAVNCCIANAAVKTSIKKGVFTVYGTGKMQSSQIVKGKNKLKIKKVVIKKGVTSIPAYAFKNCANVKSIKIASTVKTIGRCAFWGDSSVKTITIPSKVKVINEFLFKNCKNLKSVKMRGDFIVDKETGAEGDRCCLHADTFIFSTPLDIANVNYLDTNNIEVCVDDTYFKSIDGVVYSKSGKDLVRVPSRRKELKVAEGCENIAISALNYVEDTYIDGPGHFACCQLRKLTLPATVKNVSFDLYPDILSSHSSGRIHPECPRTDIIEVNGIDDLNGESFSNLLYVVSGGTVIRMIDEAEQKGYITRNGNLTIYKGNHLVMLKADEEEEKIAIPDSIISIGAGAIDHQTIYDRYNEEKEGDRVTYTKIHIGTLDVGKNVKSIGRDAFSCERSFYTKTQIDNIVLHDRDLYYDLYI